MKKKLFQFVVLYHERIQKNDKEEISTSIIIPPETLLAMDDKVAVLQIAKKIPDQYQENLQDIEIVLRPF